MLNTKFSPWPSFTEEEAEAVSRVLLSNKVNYWTGDEARDFEREYAEWTGTGYAIALANGTVALELALKALDIGPGDEVITPARSFLASASCVVLAGATPVFADIDRDTQTLSAATVAPLITPRTKAIICVHLAGWPCEMDGILDLARSANIAVIEDGAQAHGARYRDRSVGALGDIGAWSFCQDKIITTGGEGGMVTTSDRQLWKKMWAFKDHGKSWEAVYERDHAPGFRWLHESFGTNWRMTEMQAAIGRIQLGRMDKWSATRRRNAEAVWAAARNLSTLRVPLVPDHIVHGAYRAYVFVKPEALADGWDRDRIIAEINDRGVPCRSGSCSEIYLEKAFDGTGFRPAERLPVARELGSTSLEFFVHPTLTEAEIGMTCDVLRDVARAAAQ